MVTSRYCCAYIYISFKICMHTYTSANGCLCLKKCIESLCGIQSLYPTRTPTQIHKYVCQTRLYVISKNKNVRKNIFIAASSRTVTGTGMLCQTPATGSQQINGTQLFNTHLGGGKRKYIHTYKNRYIRRKCTDAQVQFKVTKVCRCIWEDVWK